MQGNSLCFDKRWGHIQSLTNVILENVRMNQYNLALLTLLLYIKNYMYIYVYVKEDNYVGNRIT